MTMTSLRNASLAIASDHAGYLLKEALKSYVSNELGIEVVDLGPESGERCDYPDFAAKVARHVQSNENHRGVLVCGSGIGMSIAVNRFPDVRGALVHHGLAAKLARQHNDANVLCLGSRLIGEDVAKDAVNLFLFTAFDGGRHAARVAKIEEVSETQ